MNNCNRKIMPRKTAAKTGNSNEGCPTFPQILNISEQLPKKIVCFGGQSSKNQEWQQVDSQSRIGVPCWVVLFLFRTCQLIIRSFVSRDVTMAGAFVHELLLIWRLFFVFLKNGIVAEIEYRDRNLNFRFEKWIETDCSAILRLINPFNKCVR